MWGILTRKKIFKNIQKNEVHKYFIFDSGCVYLLVHERKMKEK